MNKTQEELAVITVKIEHLYPIYTTKKEDYNNFMVKFERARAKATMQETTLGLKNQEMREAEVNRVLDESGLMDERLTVSNDYYRVKNELDYLTIISSNLRAILNNKE